MYLTAFGNNTKMLAIKEALTNVGISSEFTDGNLYVKGNDFKVSLIIQQDDRYFLAEKGL